MKKFLMTIAAAFVAVSMNAQLYLGGSLGFGSWSSQEYSKAGDKSEAVFTILPEVGYNLSDSWAIGTVIGYQSNKFESFENDVTGVKSESAFIFNPYARYTFLKAGKVNLFIDGGVDFTTASKFDATSLGIGLKPGLAINLNDKFSLVSHVGFIGYKLENPDGDDNNTSYFGLDMSGVNVNFGLYYNF